LSLPTSDLPRRQPPARGPQELWLPALGRLVAEEPLYYRAGAAGPKGKARLRAWETDDDGRFAVLSWVSGISVFQVARPLRGMLAERFGSPFALAELSGQALELILPPVPGQDQEWLRVFPSADGPHRAELEAWWARHGDIVLSA
jgi:hypothetical protein